MSELSRMHGPSFPIGIGNEEETMMLAGPVGSDYSAYKEPFGLVRNLEQYLPQDLKSGFDGGRRFLQAGNLVYNGGTTDSANLERATPECSKPSEFAAAVHANEKLLIEMASNFVQDSVVREEPTNIRIQRRVVDIRGNSRGCHDNFEVKNKAWLDIVEGGLAERLLMAHLATRSFITGAGYATTNGLRFGQKIEHTAAANSYGFYNSAYRTTNENDTGSRLEIRCNDINISPWAVQVRIGTSALLLSLAQTPLATVLEQSLPDACRSNELYVSNLQRFNKAPMDNDGQLQPSKNLYRALDFQQSMYDLMADSLGDYIEIPEEYQDILYEAQGYCDDYRNVLKGKEQLEKLSNRSDMAAKFSKIAASIRSGRESGLSRTANDVTSQYWDMKYDAIEISPNEGQKKPHVMYGYGYKLRERQQFRKSLSKEVIENAYYNPPKTTRAFVRGTLIRTSDVSECNWSYINISARGSSMPELAGRTIRLPEVVINGLSRAVDAQDYVRNKAAANDPTHRKD